MHLYKVKTKKGELRWAAVEDGPPHPVTGNRKQITRRGKSQREAKERLRKAIEEVDIHGLVSASDVQNKTFDEFAKEWLKTYSNRNVKISTIRIREKEIKVLNRYIAKVPLVKVSHKMYQDLLNDLHTKGFAQSTIGGVHTTANMIFKRAVVWKIIRDNPCQYAELPKKVLTVEEIESDPITEKFFEKDELQKFLTAASQYGLFLDELAFYTLAFTGFRPGELVALKWSDVLYDQKKISITKTLYNPDNNMKKYELLTPKNVTSIRKIGVDDLIFKMMKKHQAKQKEIKMKYRDQYHDENFVFANELGYPIILKTLERRMDRLRKKAEIEKHLTPHGLRHTHISLLAERGASLKGIMERVGHKDQDTTVEIYMHVTKKMHEDTLLEVSNYFKDILPESTFQ